MASQAQGMASKASASAPISGQVQLCADPAAASRSLAKPMASVPARQEELDPERPVVCICHHGARSMQVGAFLERAGFGQVINLTGGIHAWALQVDPGMPTY